MSSLFSKVSDSLDPRNLNSVKIGDERVPYSPSPYYRLDLFNIKSAKTKKEDDLSISSLPIFDKGVFGVAKSAFNTVVKGEIKRDAYRARIEIESQDFGQILFNITIDNFAAELLAKDYVVSDFTNKLASLQLSFTALKQSLVKNATSLINFEEVGAANFTPNINVMKRFVIIITGVSFDPYGESGSVIFTAETYHTHLLKKTFISTAETHIPAPVSGDTNTLTIIEKVRDMLKFQEISDLFLENVSKYDTTIPISGTQGNIKGTLSQVKDKLQLQDVRFVTNAKEKMREPITVARSDNGRLSFLSFLAEVARQTGTKLSFAINNNAFFIYLADISQGILEQEAAASLAAQPAGVPTVAIPTPSPVLIATTSSPAKTVTTARRFYDVNIPDPSRNKKLRTASLDNIPIVIDISTANPLIASKFNIGSTDPINPFVVKSIIPTSTEITSVRTIATPLEKRTLRPNELPGYDKKDYFHNTVDNYSAIELTLPGFVPIAINDIFRTKISQGKDKLGKERQPKDVYFFASHLRISHGPENYSISAVLSSIELIDEIDAQASTYQLQGYTPTLTEAIIDDIENTTFIQDGVISGRKEEDAGEDITSPRFKHSHELPRNSNSIEAQNELIGINNHRQFDPNKTSDLYTIMTPYAGVIETRIDPNTIEVFSYGIIMPIKKGTRIIKGNKHFINKDGIYLGQYWSDQEYKFLIQSLADSESYHAETDGTEQTSYEKGDLVIRHESSSIFVMKKDGSIALTSGGTKQLTSMIITDKGVNII